MVFGMVHPYIFIHFMKMFFVLVYIPTRKGRTPYIYYCHTILKEEGLQKNSYEENADQLKAAARAQYQAEPEKKRVARAASKAKFLQYSEHR